MNFEQTLFYFASRHDLRIYAGDSAGFDIPINNKLIWRWKSALDVVTNKVSLADAFASVKPETDLHADQGVEPCFADCEIFPGSSFQTRCELDDSVLDGGQVSWGWWCEFDLCVTHEDSEFWLRLRDQAWNDREMSKQWFNLRFSKLCNVRPKWNFG